MIQRPLKPFRSDGCSGFMSFLWKLIFDRFPPWEGCCIEHDRAYHKGGEKHLRKIADIKLLIDVATKGHPFWACFMFFAVRAGGAHWLPFPSVRHVGGRWKFSFDGVRWGYGHQYPRYKTDTGELKIIMCKECENNHNGQDMRAAVSAEPKPVSIIERDMQSLHEAIRETDRHAEDLKQLLGPVLSSAHTNDSANGSSKEDIAAPPCAVSGSIRSAIDFVNYINANFAEIKSRLCL